MDETSPHRYASANKGWSSSKLVATAVLVPAVPMLLLSVISLGLFYLAPLRFEQIISRLPGESLIRTALVFAPATLFAIVVLAVLYAVEKPIEGRLRPRLRSARWSGGDLRKRTGQWLLGPAAFALILTLGLWALSFITPGRYDRLLAPLPGDSYWKPFVPVAPWLLFPLTLMLAYLAFSPGTAEEGMVPATSARRPDRSLLDTAVIAILAFSLPALLASSAALILYRLRPERIGSILERLPFDSLVRLILLFAPAILLSVVILAVLFLLGSRHERKAEAQVDGVTIASAGSSAWRATLATGVLVAGLSLSAFIGLGVLGALLYIIIQ